jgi:cell division protein FtsQ
MTSYQGRALRAEPRRGGNGWPARVLRVLATIGVIAGFAHVPWGELRLRLARIDRLSVVGLRSMDAGQVLARAGLETGGDLFAVDLDRARQRLLLHPRIAAAEVQRRGLHELRVSVVEREPVLLVRHGVPWEIDSTGMLLEPLAEGVVADVPLLAGPEFERVPPGTQVRTLEVRRGLEWARILATRELQLVGRVSEVDVSDPTLTGLLLMNGTRVLAPAWPPGTRRLSALGVVLADLAQRGTVAREVDLRFDHQVIVRPAESAPGANRTRSS